MPAATLPLTDTRPPVKLAALDIVVAITLLAFRLPVKLALVVAIVPTIVPMILPPVMLPDVLTIPDPANKLPPVMLPDTDTTEPVWLATFTTVVNMPLLAVALPVTDSAAPNKLDPVILPRAVIWALVCRLPVAVTSPVVRKFPAWRLPKVDSNPEVLRLPPSIFPVTDTVVPVKLAALKIVDILRLLALMLPNTLIPVEVNVATGVIPATAMVTLPLAATLTLLLPLTIKLPVLMLRLVR